MSSSAAPLILGEFRRTIDERYRVSLPAELVRLLLESEEQECLLAKEHPGSLSLWNLRQWGETLNQGVQLIESKIAAGRLAGQTIELQRFGRILSTRHRPVQLTGRGRLLLPEGFREFLGVESGGEVFVVGAAVCLELWRPDAWFSYLNEQIPEFRQLYDRLSG